MFSDLPKLFDRDFFIGHVLPTLLALVVLQSLSSAYDHNHHYIKVQFEFSSPFAATASAAIAWLIAALLLMFNGHIYDLMMKARIPWKKLNLNEKQRTYWSAEVERLKNAAKTRTLDAKETENLGFGLRLLSMRFPQVSNPRRSSFGNVIQAFEEYPNLMYGVDIFEVWPRLLGVVPKDYSTQIDAAKSRTDFWVNLWTLSIVLMATYVTLIIGFHKLHLPVLLIVLPVVCWRSMVNATEAAREWGNLIRAAFDLFLSDLYAKLRLPRAATQAKQREVWTSFSQSITYGRPDRMPDRPTQDKEHSR